ncbi:MAG: hypothetical protein IK990_16245 [Ruminiclostridium sp.]|nr:hypothetical protein [Ruminiclostridium sp.]
MKEMLLSICVTAIFTAVYRALTPSDKFAPQVKLLVACFFAVSAVNAAGGVLPFWDITDILNADTSYNDYSVQLRQLTAEETADSVRAAVAGVLKKEGIIPEKIYVDVNIADNGSISISEIKLVFGQADYELYAARAVVLAGRVTGTAVKVTAETPAQAEVKAKERERE